MDDRMFMSIFYNWYQTTITTQFATTGKTTLISKFRKTRGEITVCQGQVLLVEGYCGIFVAQILSSLEDKEADID